jgi:DsbC/DsbD-like thiol-disulfide interchange protein/cytochrome c biogenesis protein CcdA
VTAAWINRVRIALAFCMVVLAPVAGSARAATTARTAHIAVAMYADTRHPAPGRPLTVAFEFRPAPGWHIYWTNPGDAGLAPRVDWTLPPGFSAGPLQHPVPSAVNVQGVEANLHEGRVALLDGISAPASLAPGAQVPIRASLNWLVCSAEECVSEQADLGLRLAAGDGRPDPENASLFASARSAMPRPLPTPGHYKLEGGRLSLQLPLAIPQDLAGAHLFLTDQVLRSGSYMWLERLSDGVRITAGAGAGRMKGPIAGVVRLEDRSGRVVGYSFVARPLGPSVTAAGEDANAAVATLAPFMLAFGAAVAGGVLLNLMPCVFPILSLKALALARAGGDDVEARREALGYAFGAIGVLLALGGVLLTLRAGGSAVGWAFQLQNPHVVVLLLVLCVAIALNLAGLFELPAIGTTATGGGGFLGGAGTGAMAAFVATPCTGPFMAGALGAALVLPAGEALAVFAGLGLGLSLPFLAIGLVPALRGRLPRPGRWMLTLRRLLSLPMFATTLGLAWVLGRQAGVGAMTLGLAAALALGAGLWWLGLRQASGRNTWPALAPVSAAALLALAPMGAFGAGGAPGQTTALAAQPYSGARLAELRSARRPVFVFLTADWCLSCKVNEATSLSSPDVARAFRSAGITVLKGDWTRADPEVTRLLTQQGRAGVPLYLFYPKDGPPRALPQVLTPSLLVKLAGSPT